MDFLSAYIASRNILMAVGRKPFTSRSGTLYVTEPMSYGHEYNNKNTASWRQFYLPVGTMPLTCEILGRISGFNLSQNAERKPFWNHGTGMFIYTDPIAFEGSGLIALQQSIRNSLNTSTPQALLRAWLAGTSSSVSLKKKIIPVILGSGMQKNVTISLVEHPRDSVYKKEASENLRRLLALLEIPEGSALLNVGYGWNPLSVDGYRVINVEQRENLDNFADGCQTIQHDFFADDFLKVLETHLVLQEKASVVVFYNMWLYMGSYGPIIGSRSDIPPRSEKITPAMT